ncbi:TetR/AcrR family transcriptional regulator [Janibacter cremeus]|uniref:AcrR family transcriptional regulator n=1 Tax=Janibacter cremeus TaxID=1285192 RepID=A0A852VPK0_9MICO|nr:TetR/AcrR family transcriptional regulator [Janibacter cremeus]NYF96653.1 AcrR family transcriptional regulator [Janibacter cremeus]
MISHARKRPARERLLAAAEELMFVDGVVLTPVDVVLKRAGASAATLYSNFGNKDGLIAAALERRLTDWTQAWDAAIEAADSPTGRLFAIFPALRTYQRERLAERWCAFSGTAAAIYRPSEEIVEMLEAEDELLHARLRAFAGEVAGEDRAQDLADQVAVAYLGTITGMLRGDQETAIARGELVARTLVASLVGEGGADLLGSDE